MKRLFCVLLYLFICSTGYSQFYPTQYRPPNLGWQQLQTPHFNIVFPQGEDSVAWRTARILESEYGEVQQLADGSLSNFPVILNNYNDLSNGFVSALHFRSEIEIPPIKGKALNPQSGSWLEAVEPHELVHALHLSNTGGFGIGGLVSLFSPDLARSFHGAIPSGITEGLATYHETASVAPNGGRGNHPFFYNQFNAIFDSPDRWSMGQIVHTPERTRPFNRHYMGGYEFTDWLQNTYGEKTSRDALNFYIDLPFLGYGIALKHATGRWPGRLYEEFSRAKEEEQDMDNPGKISYSALPVNFNGSSIHRPKWIDDKTLIFHGSFYNARSGFYRYDLETQNMSRIVTTNSVRDYIYDITEGRSTLIYAYYRSSPFYDNTFKSELVELDLNTGKSSRLTTNGRLYAPDITGDKVQALQTNQASSRLVRFDKEKRSTDVLAEMGRNQIIEVAASPADSDKWAVIVNQRGMQALWIGSEETIQQDLEEPPAVSFMNGSIYDISWHHEGGKLMLTSDHTGTMQIYEYDLNTEAIAQLTNSDFNAFEASYSPDGNRISFIVQKNNEQLPAVISNEEFYNRIVEPGLWKPNSTKAEFMQRPELGEDINPNNQNWKQTAYRSGISWLKPRAVLPIVEEVGNSDTYEIGAELHSNNLLQDQAYSLQLTGFEERLWYDLSYRNKTFYPGFKASAFSEPAFSRLGFVNAQEDTLIVPFVRQERSFALSFPVNITLDRNIYFSSFRIEPEIRRSQIRYLNTGGGEAASDFGNLTIGNIFSSFSYRLQQNIRDLQPNKGITLFGEVEHYFSTTDLTFNVSGEQFGRSFIQPTALRGGLFTYLSPLRRWNQSLRISVLGITQTDRVFDNQFLVSDGFSESVFPLSNNVLSFGTRYTIPLIYPDDGGFLLPFYLSNVYLVGFSNTVADASGGNLFGQTRSVFGGGIRAQFRLSNLSLDIGVGIGFEPARGKTNIFVGNF